MGQLIFDKTACMYSSILARVAHLDTVVSVDDAEHVEQLPLVLVDPLDLDVEHGVRADLQTGNREPGLNGGSLHLSAALYVGKNASMMRRG
jgi:hypothetical protein